MRSETRCQQELKELKRDLEFWRRRLEGESDLTKRKFLGNTICGVEGRIEALEWVIKETKHDD